MSYLDNDDDLFNYDPDTDPDPIKEVIHNDSTKSTDSPFQDFISRLKEQDSDLNSEHDFLDLPKLKLANAFHTATHRHYAKVETPSYVKSITVILDKITNGDFSLIQMFYRKEYLICQRLVFLSMMDVIIAPKEDSNEDSPLLEILTELGLNLDQQHIDLFYATSVNISRHSLAIDRATYKYLGERLNMTIVPELIDPNYSYDMNAKPVDKILNSDYMNNIMHAMTSALAKDGLLEAIQDMFGTTVTLSNNDQEFN